MKRYRAAEVYEIACSTCHTTQEQPCAAIDAKDGVTMCFRCGTKLRVEWRATGSR